MLEDEADARPSPPQLADDENAVLPRVVEFLDHFDEALQVVVGCARKTEVARWSFLFDVVGKPRDLFEVGLRRSFLALALTLWLQEMHRIGLLEGRGVLPTRPA